MNRKVCDIDGVGEILFVKSRRARKLTLSVKPGRGPRVTLPLHLSYSHAEKFVKSNLRWLKQMIEKAGEIDKQRRDLAAQFPFSVDETRRMSREILPERVNELADQHGYRYGKLTLRKSRTRWGSCSSKNNINLSIFLVHLPLHLIDYVILHELVHTRHKNHGPWFWAELEKVTGDARGLAKELRGKVIMCKEIY